MEERSAAQKFYDAFKKVETVVKSDDDLMMFEKSGLYYIGHEDHYFIGAMPREIAEQYYQDELIARLIALTHEELEKNIQFEMLLESTIHENRNC